jgi:hypothetical protein
LTISISTEQYVDERVHIRVVAVLIG